MINQVKPRVAALLPCHAPEEKCPDAYGALHTVLHVALSLSVKVKAKMCVLMVSGLRVTEGVLLFGKESLLLCEGFTLSSSGDVCCRTHHPSRYRCTKTCDEHRWCDAVIVPSYACHMYTHSHNINFW